MNEMEDSATRLGALKRQFETFLKEWEWTWARAAVFSLGFCFLILITVIILPSFWLYFAEQKWHLGGSSDLSDALRDIFVLHKVWPPSKYLGVWNEVRDAVAMGLTTGPVVTYIVVASWLQNTRRRLRGETGDVRPTGGYR